METKASNAMDRGSKIHKRNQDAKKYQAVSLGAHVNTGKTFARPDSLHDAYYTTQATKFNRKKFAIFLPSVVAFKKPQLPAQRFARIRSLNCIFSKHQQDIPEPIRIDLRRTGVILIASRAVGTVLGEFLAVMRYAHFTTCLFVGYLILFWNLGPSLHRADFFGLHCNDVECNTAQLDCCDHHHCHALDVERDSSDSSMAVGGDVCDGCVICDFFSHFQLANWDPCLIHASEIACFLEFRAELASVAISFQASARGPPQ